MGNENHIHILGDYSKPSYEGYMNTIELPEGNNVVPLRSNTIRLVQNGCSFHGYRSKDPNQHLKDFLKLVDSLDLDVANRERTHLRSISTWEDLTTRFLAQFFPPRRTAVSTKSVTGRKGGYGVIIRLGQWMGSCTKPSDEMIPYTIKGKPLVLPWGRTPRLDSDVKVSIHICQRMSEYVCVKCRSGVIIGLGQWMGSCSKPSDEMIPYTIKGKPLVLPWGRTP
ncbi:hypothetical protein Tco_0645653 [Tanacetum coccineum]